MALFTILEAPDHKSDRLVVVKDGFSASALIFTVFWALWHRMWVISAILFALFVATGLLVNVLGINSTLGSALEIAIGLIFGFEARGLYIRSLEKAGYHMAGLIEASSREAAELSYLLGRESSRMAMSTAVAPIRAPAAHDTLGLFGNV